MRIELAVWATVLMLCPHAGAQSPDSLQIRKQALDRAYALGKRFQTFGDRLSAARAMAILGQTVCSRDRGN